MKAKLVEFKFVTRVVVPDEASEEETANYAVKNMRVRFEADMYTELMCNWTEVTEDTDMPYDANTDTPDSFGYHPQPKS